jgi:putative addiction module component (TIGR02574 family)
VEAVVAFVANRSAVPVTQAQREELDRRLREHERNPEAVSSWEDVKSRILSRK